MRFIHYRRTTSKLPVPTIFVIFFEFALLAIYVAAYGDNSLGGDGCYLVICRVYQNLARVGALKPEQRSSGKNFNTPVTGYLKIGLGIGARPLHALRGMLKVYFQTRGLPPEPDLMSSVAYYRHANIHISDVVHNAGGENGMII